MARPIENLQSQRIEADEDVEGTGLSCYETDLPSTSSLSSTIIDYEYENGRRYHSFKSGSYIAPNDQEENERLDLVHHMITLRMGGKLHLAPISRDAKKILDLGTGTGIWAIQMADDYENARILGNDLSPIQPNFVPPNVHFEIDDIEDAWTYTQKFDYIHARYLVGAVRDWPKLVANCYKFLKPGGYIELQDFNMRVYSADGSLKEDSHLHRFIDEGLQGMVSLGVEPEPAEKLAGWVRGAGFADVRSHFLPFPVGSWPKDQNLKQIGLLNLANFSDGLEGFSMRLLTGVRGWTKDQVQAEMKEVKKELLNRAIHTQHDMYIVYAQKPLDAE